jgi:hypothetical protein
VSTPGALRVPGPEHRAALARATEELLASLPDHSPPQIVAAVAAARIEVIATFAPVLEDDLPPPADYADIVAKLARAALQRVYTASDDPTTRPHRGR